MININGSWIKGPSGAWVKASAIMLVGIDEVTDVDSNASAFQVIGYIGENITDNSMGIAFDVCTSMEEAEESAAMIVGAIQSAEARLRASHLTRGG